jgi:ATP-dependent DNA helicase RecQ
MKDQVDALQACGVQAIQIDSSQGMLERSACLDDIRGGAVRLLFVSPERLMLGEFCKLLQRIRVRTFAIDEAHCISHWGHDFRPEYRQLDRLKELFPEASVHAYTATATERVRNDIAAQLRLRDPAILVGSFDRPNLTYRVLPRHDQLRQVRDVLGRHPNEAGIIYCPFRRDVDELAAALQHHGCKAMPYHAGMDRAERQETQNAFAAEQCDVVVATVAFGMGIDRSNVRFVLHTAMPKSVEHYQQETGRAGRDGLEAECVLLHAAGDVVMWKKLIEKSAREANAAPEFLAGAVAHLQDMDRYARGAVCRHRALVQYFGQTYDAPSCHACDLCLGDTEPVADALVVAQKILSCVARVKENFGIGHVVSVLRGEETDAVHRWHHDQLSTYGLLRDCTKHDLRDWVHQLIGQQVLAQEQVVTESGGSYPLLKLNPASWEVMKGTRPVRLVQLARRKKGESPRQSRADTQSWEGVDRGLFEDLRQLRRQIADETERQAYQVFSDATLRELARVRPSTVEKMRRVYGIGDHKLREFGQRFLTRILDHCRTNVLPQDRPALAPASQESRPLARPSLVRDRVYSLFREQMSIDQVAEQTQRARSTVRKYLEDFIRDQKPASITAWVSDSLYRQVADAARKLDSTRLRPLFIELGETIPYEILGIVAAHLSVAQPK